MIVGGDGEEFDCLECQIDLRAKLACGRDRWTDAGYLYLPFQAGRIERGSIELRSVLSCPNE